MPSPLAHYAIGAAGLQAFDVTRRETALLSLWAVAPDLDVVPALTWTLVSPHLGLGPEALRTGARLLGHRGFSHTFPAALLAGLLVWAFTRDRRHGLLAGFVWALHVVLDTLTDWSTLPLWPLSDVETMIPLVTGLDPLLTVFSIGTILALLGPLLAERLEWPGRDKRASLDRWGRRWGRPLAYASLGAVAFSASMVGWTAAVTDGGTALPAGAPRTAGLDGPLGAEERGEAEAWNVTTRWLPVTEGEVRRVSYVTNTANVSSQNATAGANASGEPAGQPSAEQLVRTAECALDRLGPFAPVDRPFWTLRRDAGRWVATAHDLVRNATGTGGPAVHVAIEEGVADQAWVTGEQGEEPRFRLYMPDELLEDGTCP